MAKSRNQSKETIVKDCTFQMSPKLKKSTFKWIFENVLTTFNNNNVLFTRQMSLESTFRIPRHSRIASVESSFRIPRHRRIASVESSFRIRPLSNRLSEYHAIVESSFRIRKDESCDNLARIEIRNKALYLWIHSTYMCLNYLFLGENHSKNRRWTKGLRRVRRSPPPGM